MGDRIRQRGECWLVTNHWGWLPRGIARWIRYGWGWFARWGAQYGTAEHRFVKLGPVCWRTA